MLHTKLINWISEQKYFYILLLELLEKWRFMNWIFSVPWQEIYWVMSRFHSWNVFIKRSEFSFRLCWFESKYWL